MTDMDIKTARFTLLEDGLQKPVLFRVKNSGLTRIKSECERDFVNKMWESTGKC
jgi:hypothetical protein